ncbi:MAG: Gfo/Idh/MocA family oxidoreductase [Verrucomicrobia bacterium]|nr:Gfo/Idh/MocA family oxidoreductase [Verrucomicrobiota bacterium]
MKTSKCIVSLAVLLPAAACFAADLRIGMIGLDTSHVVAFAGVLNDATNKNHIPNARIVAAFKGGSPDLAKSWDRVEGYTKELTEKYGVKIVGSIEELCSQVDAVMLESVDGRPHLAQARPVILAGKPLFIDKPMAASLKDALEIFRLAKEHKVPVFSASSLRFGKTTQEVRTGSLGKVLSAETSSPVNVDPTHPELFWYGIHGVESLFTLMGPGCVSVTRGTAADGNIEVVGTWKDGRTGTFRQSKGYGGKVRCEKGESPVGAYDGYAPLVVEVIKFFRTGISPVPEQETIEILAFMEASDESKRLGGKPATLEDVMKKATAK